ncbi:MAG: hypothetical protein ACD_43C00184G0003 [uncultured bacterium]|nr:MAG: hypothetical protein ACD_43C00184G0003 [uncultured bacterium]
MRIAIVGNGDFVPAQKLLKQYDWIIAADGGLRHCTAMHILPDWCVGDGDSINQNQTGPNQFDRQTDQNTTDLQKALSAAADQAARQTRQFATRQPADQTYSVDLFSVTGADRLDHNHFALQTLAQNHVIATIYTPHQLIRCIRTNHQWPAAKQLSVSLLPVAASATVELQGFAWSGSAISLDAAHPGISNIITTANASITIKQGAVLSFEPILWT